VAGLIMTGLDSLVSCHTTMQTNNTDGDKDDSLSCQFKPIEILSNVFKYLAKRHKKNEV
jgi:hypothetical protein